MNHSTILTICCFSFKRTLAINKRSKLRTAISFRQITKMSVQKVPLITTLLRASRNQDEDLIKYVLQHILTNGISEEDLNAVDCSGRVSI